MPPDPESPLEPGFGQSVADTLQPRAHADTQSRRKAGGERHFCKGGGGGVCVCGRGGVLTGDHCCKIFKHRGACAQIAVS